MSTEKRAALGAVVGAVAVAAASVPAAPMEEQYAIVTPTGDGTLMVATWTCFLTRADAERHIASMQVDGTAPDAWYVAKVQIIEDDPWALSDDDDE